MKLKLAFALACLLCSPAAFGQSSVSANGKQITIASRGDDVRTVIHDLFVQSGKNYILDPGVRFTLYLSLKDVDFDYALNLLLKTAGLKFDIENGIYYVSRQLKPTPPVKAPETKPAETKTNGHGAETKPVVDPNKGQLNANVLKKTVTTRLSKIDLRELMAELTKQTGVMIEVDEKIPHYKLDAFLIGTSLKYALDQITAAANLKYRFSNALSIELVPATVASAGSEKKPASGH